MSALLFWVCSSLSACRVPGPGDPDDDAVHGEADHEQHLVVQACVGGDACQVEDQQGDRDDDLDPPQRVALPLSPGEHDPSDVAIPFSGAAAHEALAALESRGLCVQIIVRYQSLNGIRWCSRVDYVLSAAQSRVRSIFPSLQDPESGETVTASGGVGGGTVYYLEAVATPGSWAQAEEGDPALHR